MHKYPFSGTKADINTEGGGVCGVWVGVRQKDTGTRDDGGGDTKKGVRERGERD